MPVEARPLFRPDVLRPFLASFQIPHSVLASQERVRRWAEFLETESGQGMKETQLLPQFLADIFGAVLGFTAPVDRAQDGFHTFSSEQLVQVDGRFADGVLGRLGTGTPEYVAAIEGKGPSDPLDRPYAGRKMSAVDQGYRYAINLPCDWIIVTSLREIRLYYKGADQRTYERWDIRSLAKDDIEFKRFVFLLGAARMVPQEGRSHLYALLEASERAGKRLTQEFYTEYSRVRREVLRALVTNNPSCSASEIISATQRLLDRVLFVAFAEDRGLLPPDTLAKAYDHQDPYFPRPVWDTFRALWTAIDRGNSKLGIPRYNGGLFATDPLLDQSLSVPDEVCHPLKRLGDYNYQVPLLKDGEEQEEVQAIDVEILGHIFEQSIEDLEVLRSEMDGGEMVTRANSKRKREGAFYTPPEITRYIVREALRPVLEQRFEHLRETHQRASDGTAVYVFADPKSYDLAKLNKPQREALVLFWEAWIEELKTVRILDPACGSGAFLIECFDQLHAEYQQAVDRLGDLRQGGFVGTFFDPDRTILQENLYGVDLNGEAVEIARLSIWIKTAQPGKTLTDLDHNIRIGNSIVSDSTVDERAFDWRTAFPEVFARGGFDILIGNPPYVRAELLGPIKPHLQKRYAAYHGGADLYVYFYELGLHLLRPGGRLSYIVTNKWLKAGYGQPLRRLFGEQAWVEEIVDLGHAKEIFPDADVMPCILRIQKPTDAAAPAHARACVIPRDELRINELPLQVATRSFELPQHAFTSAPWTLEPPALEALFEKMRHVGLPLREYLGLKPKYGIKTGCNEAYLISGAERSALIAADRSCAAHIQPCLRGQDIKRWVPTQSDLWLIVMKSSGDHDWPWRGTDEQEAERIFAGVFPSLYAHFKSHEKKLRARVDQGVFWWELRSCDYYDQFEKPKILYTDITWRSEFAYVPDTAYFVNTVYMWPVEDLALAGVMNSPLLWSYMWRHAQHGKDEALRLYSTFLETVPIPPIEESVREEVGSAVHELAEVARERQAGIFDVHAWLRSEFDIANFGTKLGDPVELSLEAFVAEIKKRRPGGASVTSAELRRLRDEYEAMSARFRALRKRADELERTISVAVNGAYGLTADEVNLLWRTAPPRMPPVPQILDTPHAGEAEAA